MSKPGFFHYPVAFPANIIRHLCTLGFWQVFFLLLLRLSFFFGFFPWFSGFFDPIHLAKGMLAHGEADLAVSWFALIQAHSDYSCPYMVSLCDRTTGFLCDQAGIFLIVSNEFISKLANMHKPVKRTNSYKYPELYHFNYTAFNDLLEFRHESQCVKNCIIIYSSVPGKYMSFSNFNNILDRNYRTHPFVNKSFKFFPQSDFYCLLNRFTK